MGRRMLAAMMLAGLMVAAAGAAEYYVSPEGLPEGPGTKDAPYDIVTVLGGKAEIQPGSKLGVMTIMLEFRPMDDFMRPRIWSRGGPPGRMVARDRSTDQR